MRLIGIALSIINYMQRYKEVRKDIRQSCSIFFFFGGKKNEEKKGGGKRAEFVSRPPKSHITHIARTTYMSDEQ